LTDDKTGGTSAATFSIRLDI